MNVEDRIKILEAHLLDFTKLLEEDIKYTNQLQVNIKAHHEYLKNLSGQVTLLKDKLPINKDNNIIDKIHLDVAEDG